MLPKTASTIYFFKILDRVGEFIIPINFSNKNLKLLSAVRVLITSVQYILFPKSL